MVLLLSVVSDPVSSPDRSPTTGRSLTSDLGQGVKGRVWEGSCGVGGGCVGSVRVGRRDRGGPSGPTRPKGYKDKTYYKSRSLPLFHDLTILSFRSLAAAFRHPTVVRLNLQTSVGAVGG